MTTPATATDWRTRARNLAIRGEAWIDGRYVPAASGATFECLSPIDGRLIARVAATDAVDVDRAVAAARRAFDDGRWARQPPASRKKVLLKFAELLLVNRDELALLETLDMGKPISDSLAVDIPATARCIAWYAEAIDKIYDEIAPTSPDALAMVTREPVGVVAAIVPWNFPLIMAAWKIGPALAAGNSFILKPSEKSPLSAIRIAALAAEAGIPGWRLQRAARVRPGHRPGARAAHGRRLHRVHRFDAHRQADARVLGAVEHEARVARVRREVAEHHPRGLSRPRSSRRSRGVGDLLQPGRNVLGRIAPDRRGAGSRGGGREGRVRPGDASSPATRSIRRRAWARSSIRRSSRPCSVTSTPDGRRARVCAPAGTARATESGGYYVEPTVFDQVRPEMKIAREEIFGPVLATIGVKDAEEAVAVGNSGIYGLAAAVWTRDISRAHRVARALRAGVVYVNCYDADDITVPFGGFKQSGMGRDKSLHAFDKYTELKTTWIDLSA